MAEASQAQEVHDPLTWGRPGTLTPEQQQLLDEAKQALAAELVGHDGIDDAYILRFLRTRNFDAEKTINHLKHHLEFRNEMKIDTLKSRVESNKNFESLKTFVPFCHHKCDKNGSPVYIDRLGAIDPKGVLRRFKEQEIVEYHVYMKEMGCDMRKQALQSSATKFDTSIGIYDVDGLGIQHLYKPGLDLFHNLLYIDQRNYPETMRKIYVVNTPTIFGMLWEIIKPWMNPATLSKIEILGYNFKDTLIAEIGEENLPTEYGGKCSCPGGCLPRGGPVSGLTSEAEPHKVTVGNMSTEEVRIEVNEDITSVAWEFVTQDYDISFGVFYEDADGKRTEVETIRRVDSHLLPVQGSIEEVAKSGAYVLVFDNTASYLRFKEVDYHIFVE